MLKRNRRGVIGFMLTMAVGIALGAAALVVSNELARENKNGKAATGNTAGTVSPVNVERAFDEYQKAYKEYQQAAGLGREDIKKYADAFKEAKRKLEIEIFRNTPGVSEMDLPAMTPSTNAESSSAATSQSMTFSDTPSPFGEGAIVINGAQGSSAGGAKPEVVTSTQVPTALTVSPANQPVASANNSTDNSAAITGTPANTAASPVSASSENSTANSSSPSEAQITGMEYYQVKSGDSLHKICEKYYGDGGMWQHILKYQIPTIAATPNLIFPGQMIVLPKGLVAAANDAIASNQKSSGTESSDNPGNYETAPAGDNSWQERFQKDYLISDNTLTDSNTMTVAQIQRFLDAKNSVLAKPYNGSTPAQMIYDAGKKFGINPQVLLARLQCEQGMISKTSATQHQLDWALGVGCYDSGNWNQSFKGLDKQIEYAAQTYRRHYDAAKAKLDAGEAVTMNIDGQSVRVKNAASYAFYKYCPHFQGNKLFFDVWNGYRSKF